MLRRLAACSIAAVLATAAYGAAASLGISAGSIASGDADASLDCSGGTSVAYVYSGDTVTHATVSGLPAPCHGGKVWLALTDATGAKVSEAPPVTATGASATLDVADVSATLVKGYSIAVVS